MPREAMEQRAQQQCVVTSPSKHVCHTLLESHHRNILGPTKMLWLNIHHEGCAQKAPLLFWAGFIWRKWNVTVIRSLGWLCLFNSLGCHSVQEAVGWRGTGCWAPHNALGLDRGRGDDRCRGDVWSPPSDNSCRAGVLAFRAELSGGRTLS